MCFKDITLAFGVVESILSLVAHAQEIEKSLRIRESLYLNVLHRAHPGLV